MMGVGTMAKMSRGDVLKASGGAFTPLPAQLFSQMDQFMLKNPLQGFQPIGTFDAANRRAAILFGK